MNARARHGLRLLRQVTQAGLRTGQWWRPVFLLLIAVAVLFAHAVAVSIPSATYTLF